MVGACGEVLARGAQETVGVPPEEGVAVSGGGDTVSSEEKLVVETDADRKDVSLGDDDPVRVRLSR